MTGSAKSGIRFAEVRTGLNFVPGGTYFFTVALAGPDILGDGASRGRLAEGVSVSRGTSVLFTIEAVVILPKHLHAIWTLPSGDFRFLRPLEARRAQ
jgi:putative transposase